MQVGASHQCVTAWGIKGVAASIACTRSWYGHWGGAHVQADVPKDFQGFNAPDAAIMNTLTESQLLAGDQDLLKFCWWTLRKYRSQCESKFPALY